MGKGSSVSDCQVKLQDPLLYCFDLKIYAQKKLWFV